MVDLDSLIEDGQENENLDFKAVQYDRTKHEALIKDVLSFANADIHNDRYIIIGIIFNNLGEKEILEIDSVFIDSAVYQQLIKENIEPELRLEYFPYTVKGKRIGIIRIYDCEDKPYMMKKDYGKLRRGECFIRKGSTQFRLNRRDLDKILNQKIYKIGYYRLVTFQKENEYNLNLIDSLISSIDGLRSHLSLIPEEFSFYQALRISDSTNLYDTEFINNVDDYILIAKKINMWKDLEMNWIVSRGGLHQSNTQNYISALHEGKDICNRMKIKIRDEIEKHEQLI